MDHDKDAIEIARKLASMPQPSFDHDIALLAVKQRLLDLMGYDPEKEKTDDFLLRKYRELEEENKKLKNQLSLKKQKQPTALEIVKEAIKVIKMKKKGKQAQFLLIMAEGDDKYEKELTQRLYNGQKDAVGKLRALKYVVNKRLRGLKDIIVIKPIHGKDFKKGYRLTIEYNNFYK